MSETHHPETDGDARTRVSCVAVVGTLDTKSEEFAFLRDCIEAAGIDALIVDAGIMGEPTFPADVSAAQVAQHGGSNLEQLRGSGDRAGAIAIMAAGAAAVTRALYDDGRIQGVIALGGGQGTEIGAQALQVLPVGVPKVIVSTIAGLGDSAQAIIGTRDVTLVNSVVDISGLNTVARAVIANAAAAIVGMVSRPRLEVEAPASFRVAETMFGVTSPCVTHVRHMLEDRGFEVLVFAATGPGDRAMEEMIADGLVKGVIDVTTSQVGQDLIRGSALAGPRRMEVAGQAGIPQVVTLGGLDILHCWSPDDPLLRDDNGALRKHVMHNLSVTLVRPTLQESSRVGELIGRKLNAASSEVSVVIPAQGFSEYGRRGSPLYDPDADLALISSLKDTLDPSISLVEVDCHINDEEFAQELAGRFIELVSATNQEREHVR